MGIILVSERDEDLSLFLNWWTWRPILAEIGRLGLLSDEDLQRAGFNGSGLVIEAARADAIATALAGSLGGLGDDTLGLDGHVSDVRDDGTFYRDPADWEKNYQASGQKVRDFIAFCRQSGGFMIH